MVKKLLSIVVMFYCSSLFGQHPMLNDCDCQDEICYVPTWAYEDILIKPSKRAFLNIYFSKFNKSDTFYLNFDKSNLEELNTAYRNDTSLIMVRSLKEFNQYLEIIASYQKRTLAIKKRECFKLSDGDTTCMEVVEKIDTTVKYGDTKVGEHTFKFIKRINVINNRFDTVSVSPDLFTDFVSPNFNLQYYSIAPIKIYYDKVKDYYAIYIYGFEDDFYLFHSSIDTYLCKIYIDLKRKKTGRIIMQGDYLKVYGLIDCLDFWIF